MLKSKSFESRPLESHIKPPEERCPRCRGIHGASECPKINSRPIEQTENDTNNKNKEKDKQKIEEIRNSLKQTPEEDMFGYTTNATEVWLSGRNNNDLLSDIEHQAKIERENRNDEIKFEQERLKDKYGTSSEKTAADQKIDARIRNSKLGRWLRKLLYERE